MLLHWLWTIIEPLSDTELLVGGFLQTSDTFMHANYNHGNKHDINNIH